MPRTFILKIVKKMTMGSCLHRKRIVSGITLLEWQAVSAVFLLFAEQKLQVPHCSTCPGGTFFPVSPAFLESFGKTPPSHRQGVAAKKLFLTFDCKHKILHSFGSRITFQSVAFSPAVLYFEKRYF